MGLRKACIELTVPLLWELCNKVKLWQEIVSIKKKRGKLLSLPNWKNDRLESKGSPQRTDRDRAVFVVVVGVKDELQIRSDGNVIRDPEAIEYLQIGLGRISYLAFNEGLTHCKCQ